METERDLTRIVRSWLRTDEHESAERVLHDVLALVGANTQRRRRSPVEGIAGLNRSAWLAVAAAAVAVVALVGVNLPSPTELGQSSPAVPSGLASAGPSSSPTFGPNSSPNDEQGSIEPGIFDLPWRVGSDVGRIVHVTVPAGWAWIGSGPTTIYKPASRFFNFGVDVAVHSVSSVVTSVCDPGPASDDAGPTVVGIGSSVDDLTTSIMNIAGTHWSGPTDVLLGGSYPARKLVTTFSSTDCEGPGQRWIWLSESGSFFVRGGVTSTIYVLSVNGDRVVITTNDDGASSDDSAELAKVLNSMYIERAVAGTPGYRPAPTPMGVWSFPISMGPDADLRIGRHAAVVDGIPLSFSIPTSGWEPQSGFIISKSSVGPQGAEATIRWTTFPNGSSTRECIELLDLALNPSASELAAALARAPGIDVVSGPSDVTVGGRAAKHMVLTVREDRGCGPGYFYTYEPVWGGAMWVDTEVGDTISVWIVPVDGTLLFIEGEAHQDGLRLVDEMDQIVDSIRW